MVMACNSAGRGGRRRKSEAASGVVGLIYDERMCRHFNPHGEPHPERPDRIKAVWNKLESAGITQRCLIFNAHRAEDKYLHRTHTKKHTTLIRTISSKKVVSQIDRTASKFDSIYFNQGSSEAAYLAAGSVIEAAEKVAQGELNSAFAIVRPPGHHAENDHPMGFCLFNNVAIAASFLLEEKPELGIKKILIVDWDVHHGNGTQNMFWKDPRVLVFSVHRHDSGKFYPANGAGCHTMIGKGAGEGYNINVPWEGGGCGDADYLAVWDHILIPITKDFDPDLIIISAGFDAAVDDPLGGCCVTPCGYSIMLNKLMKFAQGKIVMALEGGYNLDSLADSVLACVEGLLENKPRLLNIVASPLKSTWSIIQTVRDEISAFWPVLLDKSPKKSTSCDEPEVLDSTGQTKSKFENIDSKLTTISEDMDSIRTSLENIENFVPDATERMEIFLSDSRRYFVEMMKLLGHQISSQSTDVNVPSVSHPLPKRVTKQLEDEDEDEYEHEDDDQEEAEIDGNDEVEKLTTFNVAQQYADKTYKDDNKLPDSEPERVESQLTIIARDMILLKTSATNFETRVSDSMKMMDRLASDYHRNIVETMKRLRDQIASHRRIVHAPLVSPIIKNSHSKDGDNNISNHYSSNIRYASPLSEQSNAVQTNPSATDLKIVQFLGTDTSVLR